MTDPSSYRAPLPSSKGIEAVINNVEQLPAAVNVSAQLDRERLLRGELLYIRYWLSTQKDLKDRPEIKEPNFDWADDDTLNAYLLIFASLLRDVEKEVRKRREGPLNRYDIAKRGSESLESMTGAQSEEVVDGRED